MALAEAVNLHPEPEPEPECLWLLDIDQLNLIYRLAKSFIRTMSGDVLTALEVAIEEAEQCSG